MPKEYLSKPATPEEEEERKTDPEWIHLKELENETHTFGLENKEGAFQWLQVKATDRANKAEERARKAEEEAVTDTLTGLPNRRGFAQAAQRMLSVKEPPEADKRKFPSRRYHSFSVLEIDIDHFKRINDTYGHDAGDAVLKEVSRRLKESLRGEDIVGRQGGEEFAFLLPDGAAKEIQKRFGKLFNEKPMEIEVTKNDGTKEVIPVTISGGIKEFKPGEDFAAAYAAADGALYAAKNTGRNKIVIADEGAGEE